MKNKLKKTLKFGILLLGTSLLFFTCEKEETDILEDTGTTFKVTKVKLEDFKKNDAAYSIVNRLKTQEKNQTKAQKTSKIRGVAKYNFTIDTDEIIKVENELYDSYTLPIYRDYDTDLTENLVVSLDKDNTYKSYIISYDFTEEEKQEILNNTYFDLPNNVNIEVLADFDISNLFSRFAPTDEVECWEPIHCCGGDGMIIGWTPCGGGGGGSDEDNIDRTYQYTPGGDILHDSPDTGFLSDTPSSGGSSGSSGTSTTKDKPSSIYTVPTVPTESLEEKLFNGFIASLKSNKKLFLFINNSENVIIKEQIFDFLSKNISDEAAPLTYYNEAKEFAKWNIEFEMLPTEPCGINYDCVKSIKTMANGLRRFHGDEGKLMADYFDSLIADFSSFTRDDLQVFYDTAAEITRQYNANMRKAIIFGFIEGVTPILEIALLEVGGPVAIKLLKRIPVSWVLRGARLNKMVLGTTKLGEAGFLNSRLIPKSTIQKVEELFKMLTKDAISVAPSASNPNVIVAQMGAGRKIILRQTSTTVPEAVRVIEFQNFNTALGTTSYTLKFIP